MRHAGVVIPSVGHLSGRRAWVGVVRSQARAVQRRDPPLPSVQRLVNNEVGATQLSLQVNDAASGEEVSLHLHDVEEVLYVVAGRARVWLANDEQVLDAGDAAVIPPGVLHGFANPFAEPLRVVAALASATPRTDRPG